MSKLEFTPEDFRLGNNFSRIYGEEISNTAQTVFDKWLNEQPKASGYMGLSKQWLFSQWDMPGHTHSARLIDIKPIEKKECNHDAYTSFIDHKDYGKKFMCVNCKNIIRPSKWEIVE